MSQTTLEYDDALELASTASVLTEAWGERWQTAEFRGLIALEDTHSQITYEQLYTEVSTLAGELRAAGIQPRQLVAIAMERSIENAIAILATMAAGACPCPLEPRLTPQEITDRLIAVGIDCILADTVNAEGFDAAPQALTIPLINIDILPEAQSYWCEDIQAQDPGLLLFTSGSTGRPKGVLISHAGLLNNAIDVVPVTGLTDTDKLLHVMPLYHTNGLNNQLFSPLLVGATVVVAGRFRAEEMPALMERHQPTIITGVPTMYSRMLNQEFSEKSLAKLRFARCGSAPITNELHEKIEAFLNVPLVTSYGLSEATCTSTMNPPDKRKIGSIGRALPHQRVFLRTHSGEDITQAGHDGEICIEGASLMLGYVGVSEDGVLEPSEKTLHTGDLGRFDEEGYFYITGRLKDVIIRGGENLSPTLIEQAISKHPDVASCCVIGKPDADLGEVPVAFVVARAGATIDEASVHQLVSDQLARVYKLAEVYLVSSLPENSIGKIDKKALKARLASA
jgi:acyl-CoA synthetase (AMP-forming)/AMP-acid ligase II